MNCQNPSATCGRICHEGILPDSVVLYVGDSEKYALTLAMTFAQCQHYTYDPQKKLLNKSVSNIGKVLMQR